MHSVRPILSLLVFSIAMSSPGAAAAHVNGAGSCRVDLGEYPVLHYTTVRVPTSIANADRGDVLLTQGISTNPVNDLLGVLNQLYVHTSMIGGHDSAGTRVTHTTALSLGKKLIEYNVLAGFRFKPEWLRRLPPGNVVRDALDTVLSGYNSQCLSSTDPAGCMNARSRSHVRLGSVLLKPRPAFATAAQNAVTWAENLPPHSYGYSVSAYSDLEGAWSNTGVDAGLTGRPGAMCSAMVMKALNAGGIPIANRTYTEPNRELAANALFSAVFSQIHAEVSSFAGSWVGFIPPIADLQLGLSNQVVDCFAFGGTCQWSPLVGDWMLPSSLGNGASTSPDDLIPNDLTYASVSGTRSGVQASHWATMSPAAYAGGTSHEVFDYLECCLERNGTRICRIPGQWGPGGYGGETLRTAGNPSTTGDAASKAGRSNADAATGRHQDRQEERALEVVRWISEAPGEYRDVDGSHCFVGERGQICTALPKDASDLDPAAGEREQDAAPAARAS